MQPTQTATSKIRNTSGSKKRFRNCSSRSSISFTTNRSVDVRSLLLLLISLLLLGTPETAFAGESEDLERIDTLIELRPSTAEARRSRDKKLARRCQAFIEAYPRSDAAARITFELGMARFNLQDFEKAEEAWSTFLKKYADSQHKSRVLFMRGWTLAALDRYEDSIEAFETLLQADNTREKLEADALYGIARNRLSLGQYEKAKEQFETLRKKHPASSVAEKCKADLAELKRLGKRLPALSGTALDGTKVTVGPESGPVLLHVFRWDEGRGDHITFIERLSEAAPDFRIVGILLNETADDVDPAAVPGRLICDGKGWKSPWLEALETPVAPRVYLISGGRIKEMGVHEERLVESASRLIKGAER